MAQLSKIIGSVLRDMVSAQHEANMYALKLSSAYRNQNQAASLNPPVVCLGEMELTLHCGFVGEVSASEVIEIDQTTVARTIQELSSEISEVIVTCILSAIVRHKGDKGKGEGPIARLNKEKTLRRNFIAFLGHELYSYLKGHRAEFIALDGSIDYEVLEENILFVANDRILDHSDLEKSFVEDTSGKLKKAIQKELQENIRIMLPRILKEVRLGRPGKYASMDVTVSSEELAKLPAECIQTIRMKISPRDLPAERDAE